MAQGSDVESQVWTDVLMAYFKFYKTAAMKTIALVICKRLS